LAFTPNSGDQVEPSCEVQIECTNSEAAETLASELQSAWNDALALQSFWLSSMGNLGVRHGVSLSTSTKESTCVLSLSSFNIDFGSLNKSRCEKEV
jgi:hypothetical protein